MLAIIAANAGKVDGVKVSLLDHEREIAIRRALPAGVRLYTGDDFDYPELIRGDEQGHSDALLGIFDAIAPAAATALAALDAGDTDRYEAVLAPTVPLSRHIFRAPTYSYKTGIVFLAYLNGHQGHFRMVGGQEGARSVDPPRRAVRARRPRRRCCAIPSWPPRACAACWSSPGWSSRDGRRTRLAALARPPEPQPHDDRAVLAARGDRGLRPRGADDDRAVAPQGRRDRRSTRRPA